MKYIIEVHENDNPKYVGFWAEIPQLGSVLEEESLDDMYRNAPGIIKDLVEVSNEGGANLPLPTGFEFRLSVSA